ncbi:MAG: transcriptional regulator with XRE-family HTH domain [Marivirga sp.]|jgi:transcriptional regulator with XRE-family HTH domain
MSTELYEKLIVIKTAEGLTNSEFANKIGVSENTLKGIWKRGSTPKGDILEKVSAIWPEYAYWLLTGREQLPKHISPMNKHADNILLRAADIVHDVGNLDGPIRAEWFTDIIFLQSAGNLNDVSAVIKIKQESYFSPRHISCLMLIDGMNFGSNGGGKLKLQTFAKSLEDLGRDDLIRTAKTALISEVDTAQFIENYELPYSNIKGMHIEGDDLRKIHINFSKWRLEGSSYIPKEWGFI